MKKNILIVRSLLILPLITPCLILSMEPAEKSAPQSATKRQPQDLLNQLSWSIIGRRAQLDENHSIEAMGKKTPTNDNYSNTRTPANFPIVISETETINLPPLPKKPKLQSTSTPTAETTHSLSLVSKNVVLLNQLIAEVLADIKQTPLTIEEPEILVEQTFDPMQIAHEKKAFFKELHSELLNNGKKLKATPEIAQATESAPVENWVAGYQIWIEKYQDTTKAIVANTVTLKPVSIDTPDMTQSMVALPIPTKTGFEGRLYAASFVKKPHTLIHDALIDGTFDPHNETHVEYLEQALDFYVNTNNIERLTAMLEICQHHLGKLDINEKIARKVHNFLELTAAQREIETKDILEKKYTQFVATQNALIIALQEEVAKRTKELHDKFHQHATDCDNTLAAQADYIRSLKSGTANVHGIKPQLKRAKNEPCSDKINCLSSTYNKVYMTQADVDNVYTNQHILGKIGLISNTINLYDNTRDNLDHIDTIQKATETIKLLTQ